jgi:hypothetical protein
MGWELFSCLGITNGEEISNGPGKTILTVRGSEYIAKLAFDQQIKHEKTARAMCGQAPF